MAKICTRCKKKKKLKEYGKNKRASDGLHYQCKICRYEVTTEYKKTKKGLITVIYNNQCSHSKTRGHNPPTYSKKELQEWLYCQEQFHILYDNWKILDYQKDYVPSIDRLKDDIGYTMSNIQLLSWSENNKKALDQYRDKSNEDSLRPVLMLDERGLLKKRFRTILEASEITGVSTPTIRRWCEDNSLHEEHLWCFDE